MNEHITMTSRVRTMWTLSVAVAALAGILLPMIVTLAVTTYGRVSAMEVEIRNLKERIERLEAKH
jgi:hypothetical protein